MVICECLVQFFFQNPPNSTSSRHIVSPGIFFHRQPKGLHMFCACMVTTDMSRYHHSQQSTKYKINPKTNPKHHDYNCHCHSPCQHRSHSGTTQRFKSGPAWQSLKKHSVRRFRPPTMLMLTLPSIAFHWQLANEPGWSRSQGRWGPFLVVALISLANS
jgi:hypothetical protein